MIYELANPQTASPLLDNWNETIIWSCLEGIMGKIYADNPDHPLSVMAVLGDFTFLAGQPNTELISYKSDTHARNFMIMVPQNEYWENAILKFYKNKAKPVSRYAIKKEPNIFSQGHLEEAVSSLPKGYEIRLIDGLLYHMCRQEAWCADLVSQFPDYKMYQKLGLGAAVLKNGRIVSGASSYSRYRKGIEIEIDTKEEFRRQGLAYACGARLILECLARNLYPSWDAQNKNSVALAEKLGYHYSHTYTAIEIRETSIQ